MMGQCNDQAIIKHFSGKTLLKIAGLNTSRQRQNYINKLSNNLTIS